MTVGYELRVVELLPGVKILVDIVVSLVLKAILLLDHFDKLDIWHNCIDLLLVLHEFPLSWI